MVSIRNGELLYVHSKRSGFGKNICKSRLLRNLSKLKSFVGKGGISL